MLAPTTELEAVNLILDYLGEPPVNSLSNLDGSEASRAHALLKETSRRIQTEGYSFNKETVTLQPNIDGTIPLPPNAIHVIPDSQRYTTRGGALYDKESCTDQIHEPVDVRLVRCIEFDDLPEPAKYLIAVTAARKFAVRALGSGDLVNMIMADEQSATRAFMDYELHQTRPQLFSVEDHSVINRFTSPQERGWL